MSQVFDPFFNAALDLQKQWAKTVSNFSDKIGKETSGMTSFDPFAVSKVWTEGVRQVVNQGMQTSSAANSIPDILERLRQAATAYTSLLSLWAAMPKPSSPEEGGSGQSEFNPANWMEQCLSQMSQNFNWLPKMGSWPNDLGNAQKWQTSASSMMGNWFDFMQTMGHRAAEGLGQGEPKTEAVNQFYDSWLKAYEATVGRFVNFTHVGPGLYGQEKLSKSADRYLKYQAAAYDLQSKMLETGIATLREVASQSQEIYTGEITDETMDKFYHLLMSVGERRYYELFSSPLFCQSLESMVSTGLDFYKAWSDVTEDALKGTPIVTQSQADEMHREIYSIKKRLQQLESFVSENTPDK